MSRVGELHTKNRKMWCCELEEKAGGVFVSWVPMTLPKMVTAYKRITSISCFKLSFRGGSQYVLGRDWYSSARNDAARTIGLLFRCCKAGRENEPPRLSIFADIPVSVRLLARRLHATGRARHWHGLYGIK